MYVHVPAAWIGLASFTLIALISILNFIFKIKNSDGTEESTTSKIFEKTCIGKIPIMIKSKYCSTVIKNDLHGECKYDPGGYFLSCEFAPHGFVSSPQRSVFKYHKRARILIHWVLMYRFNAKNRNTRTDMFGGR